MSQDKNLNLRSKVVSKEKQNLVINLNENPNSRANQISAIRKSLAQKHKQTDHHNLETESFDNVEIHSIKSQQNFFSRRVLPI